MSSTPGPSGGRELAGGLPPRSLGNPRMLNNLPAQVSSFIGRDTELAEVCHLVGSSRLVTLTGAGGAGKTRDNEGMPYGDHQSG
jgi:hypothetical protein